LIRDDRQPDPEASIVIDVSVVIPTHNRSRLLRQSLRSALSQADVRFEVIVVDDGSGDDTGAVIAGAGDPRVVSLRHDRSQGLSASRNHGADKASGDWIAFLDDDDVWSPHKLSRQLQAANATERSWVYVGCVNVDDSLQILGGAPPPPPEEVVRMIPRSNLIPGSASSVALRRDVFHRLGPFDVALRSAEDWEMWIRLARHGPPAWVPEPLVAQRLHAANMSLRADVILGAVASVERRHHVHALRGPLYRWIAASYLRTGEKGQWLKYLALAAARGEILGAGADVLNVASRRLGRSLGRQPRSPAQLPNPEWTARAQGWLEELRLSLDTT
jgi:glycosyltransferase involved in cell wall biosynthesis